jgi:hypothetical protein
VKHKLYAEGVSGHSGDEDVGAAVLSPFTVERMMHNAAVAQEFAVEVPSAASLSTAETSYDRSAARGSPRYTVSLMRSKPRRRHDATDP